jgi:hypothetical protein
MRRKASDEVWLATRICAANYSSVKDGERQSGPTSRIRPNLGRVQRDGRKAEGSSRPGCTRSSMMDGPSQQFLSSLKAFGAGVLSPIAKHAGQAVHA